MMEPDIIRQNGEQMTYEERRAWIRKCVDDAKANGITGMARVSEHQEIPDLILFEAWKTPPKDQGKIRWQLTAADSRHE